MPRNKKSKSRRAKSAPTSPRKHQTLLTGAMLAVPGMGRGHSSSDFDTDDTMSLCSEMIIDVGDMSPFELENEEREILDLIEDLDERGELSRQATLKKIFDKLSHRLHEEFLTNRLSDLAPIIRESLSPTRSFGEISIACKLAAVVAVSLPNSDSFVNTQLIGWLKELIRNATTIGSEVIALESLSFSCYFGANADGMESVVDLLCGIWQSTHHDQTHPKVIDAALRGWTFLMSKLPSEALVEFVHDKIPILLQMMMQSSTTVLRISLGECLCLYCDAWASVAPHERSEFPINLDEIRTAIDDISNETGRRKRSELREQKTKFRQFFKALPRDDDLRVDDDASVSADDDASVEDESGLLSHHRVHRWRPQIKLRFRSRVFEFDGWNRFIEYHRMKEMLGSGTQTHLFSNPRLQSVFDLEGVMDDMAQSPSKNEKERQKRVFVDTARRNKDDRKRGRKDKFERMNHAGDNSLW